MTLRLLAFGDIHIGRRPMRLPECLADQARELGPAGAWERGVEAALQGKVDIVTLAGDVVDRENDFFEAYRQLHRGVSQLVDHGIAVLGIAGNHDVQVLPRLAEQIPKFQLLGRNGQWEPVELEARGEQLTLWGWSFPQSRVTESPLRGVNFDLKPGLNLGLLHCDRNNLRSPYAPVSSRELEAAGLGGWLLGHIHGPDNLSPSSLSGYLGSVTGMDPGEPGPHGPWLLTVEGGRVRDVEQWTLAPLRWEKLELNVQDLPEPHAARVLLLDTLRKLDERVANAPFGPKAVGLRLRFVGRTRFGEEILSLFSDEDRTQIYLGETDIHYFIERLEVNTRPQIRLEILAERNDPPGLLARRLLLLERSAEDSDRQALLLEARRRLKRQARDERWSGLHAAELDDETCIEWLWRAGTRLLERLLAQQEATP